MLSSNATHDDLNVMKASLQTISYVLDELDENDIQEEHVQQILTALVRAMNKENVDSEIYELCGECFLNAMCMARGIFEHNQGQIIFNEVNKLARYEEDEDVRSLALQCMEEMVDRYF